MRLVMLLAALCTIAAPSFGQTIVHPVGDPVADVAAIRAAVAQGGTVLLKATDAAGQPRAFDFGDFDVGFIDFASFGSGYVALGISGEIVPVPVGSATAYVSIGNDVTLLGESAGEWRTTIKGGNIPIRNFAPRAIPGVGTRNVLGLARLTIEGIRFTESALQTIYTSQLGFLPEIRAFVQARGLDVAVNIRGNEFHDVQPALDFLWYALAAVTDGPAGTVSVTDNVVRFTSGRWDAAQRSFEQQNGLPPSGELWEGFSIADLNARGEMLRNRLEGVDVGLLVYFEGSDVAHIADNEIALRPEGFVGIQGAANHRYLIERNTIAGPGAFVDGIALWPTDPAIGINESTVRHNHIVLAASEFGGISLFDTGTGNYFGQNRVQGSAAYALGIFAVTQQQGATRNVFAGNEIAQFTPRDSVFGGTGAHVFFDVNAADNVFVGKSGTVIDLGRNNSVTGSRVRGAGPGPALAAALAAKKELLRALRPH